MKVLFAVFCVMAVIIVFVFYCCCCAASRADRWLEERDELRGIEEDNERISNE